MKVEFKGGRELQAALKELEKGASRRTAERALKRAASPIQQRAKELAPDDPATGHGHYLRDSIKIGRRGEKTAGNKRFARSDAGRDIIETYVGIDGDVKPAQDPKTQRRRKRAAGGSSGGSVAAYSQFIEFGTGSMPAQPYMRPAFEEKKTESFNRLKDDLWDEIRKTAERAARKRARKAAK